MWLNTEIQTDFKADLTRIRWTCLGFAGKGSFLYSGKQLNAVP